MAYMKIETLRPKLVFLCLECTTEKPAKEFAYRNYRTCKHCLSLRQVEYRRRTREARKTKSSGGSGS
jgi:hypothetical protein